MTAKTRTLLVTYHVGPITLEAAILIYGTTDPDGRCAWRITECPR